MDLLAQIEALTDNQLVTLAKRDDATGVLAEYRLAVLNNFTPTRETVVLGDGYAIIAGEGVVKRVEVDGHYSTRGEAEERLIQLSKARFVRKADERQFTLGPLYVPDFMDSQGEWTDPDTLQKAVWGWVESNDRRIFLQHDREVEAGSWVEVMTMPQPWTVNMLASDGSVAGEVTYPAGTVFLGVVWNDEAWVKVKRGELRGYSLGGMSGSVYAEMPEDAIREGVEVPE